jgi:signal transduction histidine kinase
VFVNALRGRPTSDFEMNLPRAQGGLARLALNVASFLSADGEVEGVIAIGRDLTEVRQLEEQVVQAEKLATLGQLAAGVVHELNNPLTSISVYSEYLLKKHEGGPTDGGDVEKLRRIVLSAQRILRFTRDLVAYARPSNEEPRIICITEVLEQAVIFCEHLVTENGAEVEKEFAEPSSVLGVKGQLHQVFINLITNAVNAMPEGAGRLRITTRAERDRMLVRVTDNGAGIPEDLRERIFEPFFSTKGEGKGTGLGLSIVRNILQQHGAEIEVESSLGEGTTFIVTLPRPPETD